MAKQSARDRAQRLAEGNCPIHGIGMPQVGLHGEGAAVRFLVGCPRKDCSILGTALEAGGPVELLQEYAHLLGPRRI